jgi:hypothetical protein
MCCICCYVSDLESVSRCRVSGCLGLGDGIFSPFLYLLLFFFFCSNFRREVVTSHLPPSIVINIQRETNDSTSIEFFHFRARGCEQFMQAPVASMQAK